MLQSSTQTTMIPALPAELHHVAAVTTKFLAQSQQHPAVQCSPSQPASAASPWTLHEQNGNWQQQQPPGHRQQHDHQQHGEQQQEQNRAVLSTETDHGQECVMLHVTPVPAKQIWLQAGLGNDQTQEQWSPHYQHFHGAPGMQGQLQVQLQEDQHKLQRQQPESHQQMQSNPKGRQQPPDDPPLPVPRQASQDTSLPDSSMTRSGECARQSMCTAMFNSAALARLQQQESRVQHQQHPQPQAGGWQQQAQCNRSVMPCSRETAIASNNKNGSCTAETKQDVLLARLCAKHQLPLPRHGLELQQQQQQQQREQPNMKLSCQSSHPTPGYITMSGCKVISRRQQLLDQLRSKRVRTVSSAAASRRKAHPEHSTGLQEMELLNSRCSDHLSIVKQGNLSGLRSDTPVSELHTVDGLQYVHALLSSIKLPAASARGSEQQQALTPSSTAHTSSLPAAVAPGDQAPWAVCGNSSMVRQPLDREWRDTAHVDDKNKCDSSGRLDGADAEQCAAALAQLHAQAGRATSGDAAATRCLVRSAAVQLEEQHQQALQQQEEQQDSVMQVGDALRLLLCQSGQQVLRDEASGGGCVSRKATLTPGPRDAVHHPASSAVHALVQQHCRVLWRGSNRLALNTMQETLQHKHLDRQQLQRQQAPVVAVSPHRLSLQAIRCVVCARRRGLQQEIHHTRLCLQQVPVGQMDIE
jgi:ribosomal protein S14